MSPLLVVACVVLAFFVGSLWQKVQMLEEKNTNVLSATTKPTVALRDISIDQIKALWEKDLVKFGDANKKVLFVEVADPSCPWCHVAGGLNPKLNREIKADGSIKLITDGGSYVAPAVEMRKLVEDGIASYIYIYYPGHANGEMGMKAMYCGYEKGKFWEVHDLLMTAEGYSILNDKIKNDKSFSGDMAQFLKKAMDPVQMKACLDSGKYDARLVSDTELARTLTRDPNRIGTPLFLVNNTEYSGAYNYTDMKATVEAALK